MDLPPNRVELRCNRCERVDIYAPEWITVHPRREDFRAEGWDGVLLSEIVTCAGCGAEDDYAFTEAAWGDLETRIAKARLDGSLRREGSPLVEQETCLSDGTVARRQSQALAVVRALTERTPERGDVWRRLGNMEHRLGRRAAAEAHYRKAINLDQSELEAVITVAEMCWLDSRFAEVVSLIQVALERVPRSTLPAKERALRIAETAAFVENMLAVIDGPMALVASWKVGGANRERSVVVGAVDLRRVRKWPGLLAVLLDPALLSAGLTSELPAEGDTALARRIEGTPDGPNRRANRAAQRKRR